ncbi:MAG: hypothetical protein RXR01_02455 [Thermoproteus sp.]
MGRLKRVRIGRYVVLLGRRSAYIYKISREGQRYIGPVGLVRGRAVLLIGERPVKVTEEGIEEVEA